MRLQGFYPIIVTDKVTECRDFYLHWFGMNIVFEASWFVLFGTDDIGETFAIMSPDHPTAPPGPDPFNGRGMCMEFEVEDAQAEYERFVQGGASIVMTLRDEPFGQRRFGLFDPAGVWIDIVQQVEPQAGWWDKYMVGDV